MKRSRAATPATELPRASRPGLQTQTAQRPGTIADAAADAALAGEADAVGELARRVVGAARQHHGVDALSRAEPEQAGAVVADPVAGEEQRRAGDVAAGHRDRALADVLVQNGRYRVAHVAVGGHEVRERAVAVGVAGLGRGHLGVDVDVRAAAFRAQETEQRAHGVAVAGELVGHHQRTRVDERVARDAVLVFQLHQGVERVAGRFAAHARPDVVAAGEHQGEGEDLRHALHGERPQPVARAVHGTVHIGHRDAESRPDPSQGGDVVRDGAPADLGCDVVRDPVQQRREIHGRSVEPGGTREDSGSKVILSNRNGKYAGNHRGDLSHTLSLP